MSLDVYLIGKNKVKKNKGSGIWVRENGSTIEISESEFKKRFPNREPVKYIDNEEETNNLFSANITHNLGKMADAAGIYYALWRPEEKNWKKAKDIIKILRGGLQELRDKPDYFKQFNPENGWGDYEGLVEFVQEYLEACEKYPNAKIEVSR